MDFFNLALVYIPVSGLTMLVNIFLFFCMFFRQQGIEHLKQPLHVLLGTLVVCNITLQICTFLFTVTDLYSSSLLVYNVTAQMLCFTMRTSVTSSFWLNVFYYCQIVPGQHSVFNFLKRNIRFFIYSSMVAEKIFFLFGFSANIESSVLFVHSDSYTAQWNVTFAKLDTMYFVVIVDMWLRCGYLLLCLCAMMTSSCATIHYLQKHMKHMEGSSSSFSSPRLRRQMRVTITGMIQAFLFFLCLIFLIMKDFFDLLFNQNIDMYNHIGCTVVCLYTFGTTLNLCVGQTIFRQRLFEVWQKCLQPFTLLSK